MKAATIERPERLRLGVLLWASGFAGVVVITVTVLPQLVGEVTLPAPMWALMIASMAQSGVLLAIAIWIGVALAPAVGLRAPAFEAAANGRPVWAAIRPQLSAGLVAGVAGGLLLFTVSRLAPSALVAVQDKFQPPLIARVLYGGITEELLLRWGLMTLLVWLGWRFLQSRRGNARAVYVWLAILVSAIAFGAGHLPAAAVLVGTLSPSVVTFVLGANTMFGLLFGFLYWRVGLEAAMMAHGLAHVVNYLATPP